MGVGGRVNLTMNFSISDQWPEALNPCQAPWVPDKAGDSGGVSSEVGGGERGNWRREDERNWLPEVRGRMLLTYQ